MDTVKRIENCKIIAKLFSVEKDRVIGIAKALLDGGIDCIEIPFDPKGVIDDESVADEIMMISCHFGEKVCVGAGAVTDSKKVMLAKKAQSDFVIMPNTDKAVIDTAKEQGLAVISGAFTPSEIMMAHAGGADIINVFPASFFGTEYIEEINGELPDLKLLVSGGISVWNMRAFLDCGCIGAVVGGNLVSEAYKNYCDFEIVAQTAIAYRGIADNIRKQ